MKTFTKITPWILATLLFASCQKSPEPATFALPAEETTLNLQAVLQEPTSGMAQTSENYQNGIDPAMISQLPLFTGDAELPQTLHLLDVDGSYCAIAVNGHAGLLIDTGRSSELETTLSYLDSLQLSNLDILITSTDPLHADNLIPILRRYSDRIRYVGIPLYSDATFEPMLQAIKTMKSCNIRFIGAESGKQYDLDGFGVEFLYPFGQYPTSQSTCLYVYRVSFGGYSCLFTGNLDSSTEELLLDTSSSLRSDILIVPGNATADSLSPDFLQSVAATYAYIPYSSSTISGHSYSATALLDQSGIISYVSLEDGTVVFEASASGDLSVRSGVRTHEERDYFVEETLPPALELSPNSIVFYDGTYYHAKADCYKIRSNSIKQTTLDQVTRGMYPPCPVCVGKEN